MTSVRYLHTMRFLKEILAFLSHFPQLIDAFQRMKARERGNLVNLSNYYLSLVFCWLEL
jgi:vacuolar protein sorting-associated protein 13D